jgi:ElaB/YqjD/DUF883 family membrane-anchored ribosome-binding protein
MTGTNGTVDKAQDAAKEAMDNLSELGRELRQKGNEVRQQMVKQLNTAAETLRKEVRDNKAGDEAQKSVDEIAKGLEKAAHYLNNHTVEQMGGEATKVVKENPARTLFIVFIVGLIVGLILRGGSDK